MSFFHRDKGVLFGREVLQAARKRFADLVGGAKAVVIVGLAIREHDEHVWSPLAKSGARIVYVAGRRGHDEFSAWSSRVGRPATDLSVPQYFKEALPLILRESGLAE